MDRRTFLFGALALASCGDADSRPIRPADTPRGCESSEPISQAVAGGDLAGTLLLPERCGAVPLALIHVGSGPTDRDGNSIGLPVHNDSLKLLAEGLAQRGIASVRYDKRLIGASASLGPAPVDLRFDDYADDLAAWIETLASDARFSRLTIIGHSEGSLIAMRALQQTTADAFVSLAGAGRPAADVLREQLGKNLAGALLTEANAIIDELEVGNTVSNVPAELLSVFDPSVQPYLISWFQYDPAVEIAAVDATIQVINGTTDIQIPPSDAELLAAAKPGAELVIIDGMNHVLKQATLDDASQNRAYTDPSLPVMTELFDAIAPFAM